MEASESPAPQRAGTGAERQPAETWIDVCLSDIHAALEASLPQMDGTRLEARGRLEEILGETPSPELLEAMRQVADAPDGSALRMGLGRLVLALAVLVRRELRVLSELRRLDPGMLRRQAETIPALVRRLEGLESDLRGMMEEGSADASRLRKLRVSLLPSVPHLQGVARLVAAVQQVTDEAPESSPTPDHGLSDAECAWFAAAVGRGAEPESLAPRALLDAVALRVAIDRDLDLHFRGSADTERLRRDITAYDLVAERLAEEESRARASDQASLARRLTGARQELLPRHRKLVAILRRGEARPRPTARRRPRTAAFVTAAATFAAAAAILFGTIRQGTEAEPAPGPPAAEGNSPPARPELAFSEVSRRGDDLIARVPAMAWRQADAGERHEKIYGLGLMAFRQGLRRVRIVDDGGRELASWSRDESIEIYWPERSTRRN